MIGFTKFGVAKFSLASFIHSKIGIVSANSLFSFMQSFAANSVATTYAPIVIPIGVVSYAGYHIYVNVLEKKKNKNIEVKPS